MDRKRVNLVDILIFLYIFFLPFIRIGVKIFNYTFSISDFILINLFIYYLSKKFNNFVIKIEIKKFLMFYLIFLVFISFSLINALNIKAGIIDLLAYIYGGILMFIFSLYLSEREEYGLAIINYAFIVSIFLIGLISLLLFTNLEIKKFVISEAYKYIFFMRYPNQLAIYLIICFSIYLVLDGILKSNNNWINNFSKLIPPIFFITVVLTGSGVGMFIAFFLIIYYYFLELKKKKIFSSIWVLIVIGLIFIILVLISPDVSYRIKYESKLLLRNIFSFSLTKGDMREENFKTGINIFFNHPIKGVGLGNVIGNYCENEIHNSYISFLAETGIIGSSILFLLLIYPLFFIFKIELNIFFIYASVLFFAFFHYIFRERWWWLFFILFFYIILYKRKN